MKKKTLAGLISACVLLVSVGVVCYNVNQSKTGVLEENAVRSLAEIQSETVTYLDQEAIALADSSQDSALRGAAMQAFNQVNEIRASYGVQKLAWDMNLEATSNVRAMECASSFSHTRPNGQAWYTVNSQIMGGENLAFGYSDPNSATEAWVASPTHFDNIIYPEFTSLAISIYVDPSGTWYWAQEYGY